MASEGLKDKEGNPIVQPIYKTDRATYFGDVASHLQMLIISKLGIKARSEKPGLICRCASSLVSELDIKEALEMGKTAAAAALDKINGVMAGIKRVSSNPYKTESILIPIEQVMLEERVFPSKYISEDQYDVTEEFIEWMKPLIDEPSKVITFLD